MDTMPDNLVESIQSSGYRACLVVAGGGTGAVHALLSHPGASRFVLEAQVPYSPRALFDYLGEEVGQACSREAAETMAGRAFERAMVFSLAETMAHPILGIACTAALQTTRERRGADRAHVCIKARKHRLERKIELEHGSRAEQEAALSDRLLALITDFISDNP